VKTHTVGIQFEVPDDIDVTEEDIRGLGEVLADAVRTLVSKKSPPGKICQCEDCVAARSRFSVVPKEEMN